jgi:hypothetical protein
MKPVWRYYIFCSSVPHGCQNFKEFKGKTEMEERWTTVTTVLARIIFKRTKKHVATTMTAVSGRYF